MEMHSGYSHDAAVSVSIIRKTGAVLAMLAMLGGLVLLWPPGMSWIAVHISPDGDIRPQTLHLMRKLGLIAAALLFLFSIASSWAAPVLKQFFLCLAEEYRNASQRAKQNMALPVERRILFFLLFIILLGMGARLVWIQTPIRLDEAISFMNYSRLGFLHTATHYHTNSHTLNSLLMVFTSRLFGESEWALRLPSLLASVLTIPLVFFFFRRIHTSTTAILAAALVAIAPGMIEFGFLARGYSLAGMLLFLLLLCLHKQIEGRSAWATVGMALLPAGMMYVMLSSLYAVLLSAIWGILLAWSKEGIRGLTRIVLPFAVSALLTILLFIPLLIVSGYDDIFHNYYVQPQPLAIVLRRFPESLVLTWQGWWRGFPLWIPSFTLPFFLLGAFRLRSCSPWWVVLLIVPPLIFLQRVVPYPRTWILFFPLYLGTTAAGFGIALHFFTRRPLLPFAFAGGIAIAGAAWSPLNKAIEVSPECSAWLDDRAVATALAQQDARLPDHVVSNSVYSRLHYYFRRLGLDHDMMDFPPTRETKRVFIIQIPDGVEWRMKQSLAGFEKYLGAPRLLQTFELGTTLSVAEVREGSTPSNPSPDATAPAP